MHVTIYAFIFCVYVGGVYLRFFFMFYFESAKKTKNKLSFYVSVQLRVLSNS